MTIVVLLILAGVSINLVVGQNGLITRAKEAQKRTEEAQLKEKYSFDDIDEYKKFARRISSRASK